MIKLHVAALIAVLFHLPADAQTPVTQPPGLPRPPGTASAGQAVRRLLVGLDANPKASTKYKRGDWRESIKLMKTTGANQFHYAKVWSEVEPRPGDYELDDVRFISEESSPLPVAFNLRVLDAGARNMPDAYKSLAWDSPEMIRHVTAVVEALGPVLGPRPWSYAIGNEVDMYFATRPAEVPAYARMLQQVKVRVRALHPYAGFTVSFQSSAAPQMKMLYAPIFALLDHVAFTYYPLGADFMVRPPTSAPADVAAMLAAVQPLPVMLQEVGYPTAALLGSSPELQRVFIQQIFDAVQAQGTSRILSMTYLFQADLPEWFINEIVKAYGLTSQTFRAYVSTLGLRNERDEPKPAWNEFAARAKKLGPNR